MSLDGDELGWAVNRTATVTSSSSVARTIMPGTNARQDDEDPHYAKYAVVVGKVLAPPPSPVSHHRRANEAQDQQHAYDGIGGGAVAPSSDRIPSRPLRTSSSERSKQRAGAASSADAAGSARWTAGHAAGGSVRPSCHPQPQQRPKISAEHDLDSKLRGAAHPVIEVAPGVKLRLRGSQETWAAISRDFYVPGLCWGCSETIFVIQDAAYVLCPTCRTVSPMDGTFENPEVSGVGLGFTFEELVLWQQQIADERDRSLYN
jgi:hypothetical protein